MKLFLSGAENKKNLQLLIDVKQKYIFMSYLYLKKRESLISNLRENGIKIMLDSGAYTFLVRYTVAKEKGSTVEDPVMNYLGISYEQYAKEYTEFIRKNQDWIISAVDLDIQRIIGIEKVDELRSKYFIPLEKEVETKICYVLHKPDIEVKGRVGKLFRTYGYLGFSKIHDSLPYGKVFSYAKKHNTKIHGFAVTGIEIRKFPFFSVDSTTWTMGARFGTTYILKGGTLQVFDHTQKHRRKTYKILCKKLGIDFKGFMSDNSHEVMKFNIYQWKLFADYMENRWSNKMDKPEDGEVKETLPVSVEGKETLPENKTNNEEEEDEEEFENLALKNNIVIEEGKELDFLQKNNSFLYCSDCYLNEKCPKYDEGKSCSFNLEKKDMGKDSLIDIVSNILNIQYNRVLKGKLVEEVDGGVPDKVLSNELSLMMGLLRDFKELVSERDEVTIKAKGKEGTGVLAKLFGNMGEEDDKKN